MNAELKVVLEELAQILSGSNGGGGCGSGCCDCTTGKGFEASAVRHNEAQAFAAAESSKAFVQQQGASFAQLLAMQQDFQTKRNK